MSHWLLYLAEAPSGRRYVGVTSKTLKHRVKTHQNAVTSGSLIRFHRALRKYRDAMIFTTLVVGTQDYILDLEPKVIALYRTLERRFGYNVGLGGVSSPILNPDVVVKIARSNTGKKRTPEQCKRMTAHLPRSPDFYAARSAKWKAERATPEYKAKQRATLCATYESKPELKARLAEAAREQYKDPNSKLARANRERMATPEWKEYRRQVMIAYNADPSVKTAQRERNQAKRTPEAAAAWAAHYDDPENVPKPRAKKPSK